MSVIFTFLAGTVLLLNFGDSNANISRAALVLSSWIRVFVILTDIAKTLLVKILSRVVASISDTSLTSGIWMSVNITSKASSILLKDFSFNAIFIDAFSLVFVDKGEFTALSTGSVNESKFVSAVVGDTLLLLFIWVGVFSTDHASTVFLVDFSWTACWGNTGS